MTLHRTLETKSWSGFGFPSLHLTVAIPPPLGHLGSGCLRESDLNENDF